ncbi:MAG: hypothetical protein K0Q57_908, partial [Gammaproteobacteria bacterium]|nr:hypothetical protein [Gammaproteobacteria bacterium]
MPVTNSLEALPQDLIIQISSYLRLLDKLKLSCVSKHQKQSIRVSAEERELARSLPNLIRGELSVNQIQ